MSSIWKSIKSVGRRLLSVSTSSYPGLSATLTTPLELKAIDKLMKKILQATNKYDRYRLFTELDPELYGAIDRIAKLVRYSYKGVGLRIGAELEEKEKRLLRIVEQLERQFQFRQLFYAAAFDLLRYGDSIWFYRIENPTGLVELRSLPINCMTIIEDESQLGDPTAQVFSRGLYVLNELYDEKRKIFKPDQIMHFSLNPMASEVHDILGRYTYGVWSVSPIEPLVPRLYWKLAALRTDILLRRKIVPREHIKLDLSMFDPNQFEGKTREERIRKARQAAQKFVNEIIQDLGKPLKEPDQSYVTDKDVEIDYVEPRKVTYADPSPLFDQINQSIFAAIGPIETAVTGRGRRTFATELVISSYVTICAETIADIIREQLVELIRRHIRVKYPGEFSEDDLDKIDVKIQLILGIERGEVARQVAVLRTTGLFTMDELRAIAGAPPLSPSQREELLKLQLLDHARRGREIAERTIDDILASYIRREGPEEPITPESRSDKQEA